MNPFSLFKCNPSWQVRHCVSLLDCELTVMRSLALHFAQFTLNNTLAVQNQDNLTATYVPPLLVHA